MAHPTLEGCRSNDKGHLTVAFVYSSTSQTLDPARQIFGRGKTGDYDLQRSRAIILSLLVAENDRSRP